MKMIQCEYLFFFFFPAILFLTRHGKLLNILFRHNCRRTLVKTQISCDRKKYYRYLFINRTQIGYRLDTFNYSIFVQSNNISTRQIPSEATDTTILPMSVYAFFFLRTIFLSNECSERWFSKGFRHTDAPSLVDIFPNSKENFFSRELFTFAMTKIFIEPGTLNT